MGSSGVNLFWNTRNLTQAREDHLTEFIGGALELSPEFRKKFTEYILIEYAEEKNWKYPEIQEISTQVSFSGTSCCPDMKISLLDGHEIVFEHKLAAVETDGPEGRGQLERYAELPVDGLVYIRADWKKVDPEILEHEKYINPPDSKPHFLWRDFYPLVSSVDGKFISWLKEGFEKYGFVPPPKSVGELFDEKGNDKAENQKEFGKYWDKTKAIAGKMGWKTGIGRRFELYLEENPDKPRIFICPSYSHYPRFKVQIDADSEKLCNQLITKLKKVIEDEDVDYEKGIRANGAPTVSVLTTLNKVVGDATGALEVEAALYDFIVPILKTV